MNRGLFSVLMTFGLITLTSVLVWAEGAPLDGDIENPRYIGNKPNLNHSKHACAVYLRNGAEGDIVAHLQPIEPKNPLSAALTPETALGFDASGQANMSSTPQIITDPREFLRAVNESNRPNNFLRVKSTGLQAARFAEDFPAADKVRYKKVKGMQESLIAEAGVFKKSLFTVHSTYFIRANDHSGKMTIGMAKEALMDGKTVTLRLDSFGSWSVHTGMKHLLALVHWYNDNKHRLPGMRNPLDPHGERLEDVKPDLNIVAFGPSLNLGAALGNVGRAAVNIANGSLIHNAYARTRNWWNAEETEVMAELSKAGANIIPLKSPIMDYNNISPAHNSHDKYTIGDLNFPEYVRIYQRTGNDEDNYRMDPRHTNDQGKPKTHHDFAYLYENLPGAAQRKKEDDVAYQFRRIENWLNNSLGNRSLKVSLLRLALDRLSGEPTLNDGRNDGLNDGRYTVERRYVLRSIYRDEIQAIDEEYYEHINRYTDGIAKVNKDGLTNIHAPGFFDDYFTEGYSVARNFDVHSNFANVGRMSPLTDMGNDLYREHRQQRRPERNSITDYTIRNLEAEDKELWDFTPYPRFHDTYIKKLRLKLATNPEFRWNLVGDHLLTNDMWLVQVYFTDHIWPQIMAEYGQTDEERDAYEIVTGRRLAEGETVDFSDQVKWYKYGRYDEDSRINPDAQFEMGLNHAKAQIMVGLSRVVITSSNRDQLSLTRNSEIATGMDSKEAVEEFLADAREDLLRHSVLHNSSEDKKIVRFINSMYKRDKKECYRVFGRARCLMTVPRARELMLKWVLKPGRGVL